MSLYYKGICIIIKVSGVTKVSEGLELQESILEEILNLDIDIRPLSDGDILYGPSDQIEKLFHKLDSLITLDLGNDITLNLLRKQELEPAFDEINRFRSLYTVRLETQYANQILASQSPWDILERFPFYKNYLRLVRTEYEGFRLKPGDRVLFLGSGPLPLTLIVFLKQYGIRSIGLEKNFTSADFSRKVLYRLGLSEDINIINGNHFSLSSADLINSDSGAKAIMIAAQAEPKKEILDYLLKIVPAGCRISYRIYEKGLMRLLSRNILFDFHQGFEEQRVQPEPPAYNTVVFLEKKTDCSRVLEH